jgi:tetratricopeptide (TPR) repeat protein
MTPSFLRSVALALGVLVAVPIVFDARADTTSTNSTKKKKKKKADASSTDSTPSTAQPDSAAAAAPAAAPKKEERKGPAKFEEGPKLKLEDAEKDALTDQKRDEEIEGLKKLVPRFEDGQPQKADLLFQLSELYWEKSKFLFRKEMKKFQDEQATFDKARDKGSKGKEPKEDHRESELYRSETMRLYETILKEYPAYERKDEVLFSLGYNLFEIGKKDQAVKRYNELIKNYPSSKFVPDTYVQLGNYYFDTMNDLQHARENYQKAYKSSVPKIKSYALYKLAWCDYNDHAYDDALKKMQDVVDFAEKNGKEMVDLKNEALNDMVQVYVQLDRPDDAMDFFRRKAAKKRQTRLISKMAYQLSDAGHFDSAIKCFRQLLTDQPLTVDAPELQQAIVKAFEGMRKREQVKTEIKRLVDLYHPGSDWWTANAAKQEVLRNAFNVTEEAMRQMVTEYHQEAQKTKQVETYRLARDIYKQYVDAFASSQDPAFVSDFAFDMRFYYAEILWALEEWDNAAAAYDAVVKFKIPDRDTAKEASHEKYRQVASYDELLAYGKLVKIERGQLAKSDLKEGQKVDEQKKKGSIEKGQKITKRSAKELEEKPLTKYEQLLADACDQYNKSHPGNQDEIDVRYQAAVIYYDRNHFVDAAKRFGEIILKWPEERRSQDAADLSMSVLEERQEWLELNKLGRQFQANKRLTKSGTEFAKRVGGIVEGSQYKWVDEVIYKREKNPGKAAEEFLKFVAEFPKSDNADRALAYAMLIFKDANQIDRGIHTGQRLLKEYPESPFELKARFTLAKFYEQTADFEKSARMYEDFIAAYDEATDGKDLPADLKKERERAQKGKKAPAKAAKAEKPGHKLDEKEVAALHEEAKKWLSDAQFNAALWWEGLGQTEKAVADYQGYIQRFKDSKDVPQIAFNIGLIYAKAKRWNDAIKTFEAFTNTYAKDSRTRSAELYLARYQEYLAYQGLEDAKGQARMQEELLKAYPKLSADDKKDAQALSAYAQSRFLALEPTWKAFGEVKLTKLGTFKNDLKAKSKKMEDLQKSYADVLAIGAGEWGIAALTRIGLAYADFAQNISDLPAPKQFDAEQKELFRAQLEEQAQPLEDKAIEAFEKALGKAYELSVYGEWTLLAQEKINKYRPGAYPKAREIPFQGSEFFATAPLVKEAGAGAAVKQQPSPPEAPKADNSGDKIGQSTASRAAGAAGGQ